MAQKYPSLHPNLCCGLDQHYVLGDHQEHDNSGPSPNHPVFPNGSIPAPRSGGRGSQSSGAISCSSTAASTLFERTRPPCLILFHCLWWSPIFIPQHLSILQFFLQTPHSLLDVCSLCFIDSAPVPPSHNNPLFRPMSTLLASRAALQTPEIQSPLPVSPEQFPNHKDSFLRQENATISRRGEVPPHIRSMHHRSRAPPPHPHLQLTQQRLPSTCTTSLRALLLLPCLIPL
ncbi:hypothetical protein B0T21DRAFT_85657 [Apiosordaria backusii]|uniref:Uncharacterized protein n=1 Tax=Apiosordaria backusii TaxID=314023 RepID=A0AA40A0W4_9PEZI|nr:hypothetical protein B0T21DRAFT_85657 [Apiosordaria backusii]